MSTFLIYFIIISAVTMLLIGFWASTRQLKKMDEHPEEYRNRWSVMEDTEEKDKTS